MKTELCAQPPAQRPPDAGAPNPHTPRSGVGRQALAAAEPERGHDQLVRNSRALCNDNDKEWLQAAPQNRSVTVMRFMEEEWEAAMAALRDLHVTANRLFGEAAQDKARADYEIIY